MANLRVIYDNAVDRATLSSTATVGSLSVSNLTNDIKSSVCRSTSTALAITATWTTAETISAVAAAFTNMSDVATMQVDCYTLSTDSSPAFTTTVNCSQGGVVSNRGVNYFAYGGGIYARCWLGQSVTAQKVVATLSDPTNPQGYVEASRLVIGNHWEPSFGVEQDNTTMTIADTSEQTRTYSGDVHVTVKPSYKKQTLSMPSLNAADRSVLWQILWSNGMRKPIYWSVFPEDADPKKEQAYQLYGRLASSPAMSSPFFNALSAKLDIEEL